MLLKVDIKCYCVKNKGGILYEKNSIKRSMPITCIMFAIIWSVSDVDDVKMLVQWMQLVME